MIYQELNLAPELSVVDNVMLGTELHQAGFLNRNRQKDLVYAALSQLGVTEMNLDTPVKNLSVGACQLVEITKS